MINITNGLLQEEKFSIMATVSENMWS